MTAHEKILIIRELVGADPHYNFKNTNTEYITIHISERLKEMIVDRAKKENKAVSRLCAEIIEKEIEKNESK